MYRYTPLTADFYKANRARLAAMLPENSIAIFFSNDIMPTSADGLMAFKQSSDLFYLTGVDQEETVLVLMPSAKDPAQKEILFVRETSEAILQWEGYMLSKPEATALSGVTTIRWSGNFEDSLHALLATVDYVYLNSNEHTRSVVEVETREMRENAHIMKRFPLHTYRRVAPMMHALRAIKAPEEIAQIQKAINITEEAFRRVLKFTKPGVMEYEIEAEIMHTFLSNGSRGHAYRPIIASGANACILHYIDNSRKCNDGDLMLLDFGAEYGNYNADLSRCIPVNGTFSKRQKEVYNAVLAIHNEAKAYLKPGNKWADWQKLTLELTNKACIDLGLYTAEDAKKAPEDNPLVKKYFMHGVGHFLGHDVHDVGFKDAPFAVGNVYTVEPGIYIREEGIGVRIENNVVLTANGNFDMMANIPNEADAIETLMNS